jgi:hypothetical protein
MTARTVRLGFFSSVVLFAVVIAVPSLAHWKLRMNALRATRSRLEACGTRPMG